MSIFRKIAGLLAAPEPEAAPFGSQTLELALHYRFRHQEYLTEALTHRSFINEQGGAKGKHNERLEFLGDAILDLAISESLWFAVPEAREGELSRLRSAVVNERTLWHVAQTIGLGQFLYLGKGEEISGGRDKPSILADAVEAIIAAIFIDGGYAAAREVVRQLFAAALDRMVAGSAAGDFKSELQEWTQQYCHCTPCYRVAAETGPDHDKTFEVAAFLDGKEIGRGVGHSKKAAEQEAAAGALRSLKHEPPTATG